MYTINLTHDEIQLASQLMQDALEDLRVEVRHTDRMEYKEELKRREYMLQSLAIKIEKSRLNEEKKVIAL